MMQPNKKFKADPAAVVTPDPFDDDEVTPDPFDDDEDWDNDDDILQLVVNEVPTFSQLSQAIKAPPVQGKVGVASNSRSNGTNVRSKSFTFKRPSASTTSLLSAKPASYMAASSTNKPELASASNGGVSVCMDTTSSATQLSQIKHDPIVDMSTLQKQVSDLIRKQHAHEGEIKWLRTTLKDKDNQVNTVRTALNAEAAKQRLQSSERERGYVKDIESLRSELQFKESELINITQALDKLKREKDKPSPPKIRLGADGFPIAPHCSNCQSISNSRIEIQTRLRKTEPMDTDSPEASTSKLQGKLSTKPVCDLKPAPANHLVPRKLSAGEYKRRVLISGMLRSNMEGVLTTLHSDANTTQEHCLQLLTESIACSKDLCFT